jgi:hypothetical protein
MGRNRVLKLNRPFSDLKAKYSYSFLEQFKTADIPPLTFSNFPISSQDIGNKLFDLLPLGI